jgi:archaemetzincin
MKRFIRLLKIGQVDKTILVDLRKNLDPIFKEFKIFVDPSIKSISLGNSEYDKKRRQYNASKILKRVTSNLQNKNVFRILGIIDQDIYSEPLNFVFGLAQSPQRKNIRNPVGALISITRLRESFYRRPEDYNLFEKRILKEAIHELGHTFSLPHCEKFCIMRFSNSLSDTDDKPASFCNSCLENLKIFFRKLDNAF